MRAWLAAHFAAPYPTAEDRRGLAEAGGITEKQVVYWFSNARKRTWKVRRRRCCGQRYAVVKCLCLSAQRSFVAAGFPAPTPGRPTKRHAAEL